jgi:peptide/nickel transport system permease protein
MWLYILRRFLITIPVIFGLVTITFLLLHLLPGDATQAMETGFAISAEQQEEHRRQLGLDKPLYVQYGRYIFNVMQGDFGRSMFNRQPVTSQIFSQLPATIQLAVAAMLIAIPLGMAIGIVAAIYEGTWIDRASMALSLFNVSMPNFWIGLVLIFIFAVRLGWFPAAGTGSVKHLVLPAVTLSAYPVAVLARLVRSSMLEVLRQDYIIAARAKGLQGRQVIIRHALRNALIPVVTIIGMQFSFALGGAVVIETVFARQGIGHLAVTGILQRDLPLVSGVVIFVGVIVILMNLLVDLLYGVIDPRIRYS